MDIFLAEICTCVTNVFHENFEAIKTYGNSASTNCHRNSLPFVFRDVYEGTMMATVEDLPGIRKIIQSLEDSGVLVCRTDAQVS
jgi:hypothetical protein